MSYCIWICLVCISFTKKNKRIIFNVTPIVSRETTHKDNIFNKVWSKMTFYKDNRRYGFRLDRSVSPIYLQEFKIYSRQIQKDKICDN